MFVNNSNEWKIIWLTIPHGIMTAGYDCKMLSQNK